MSGIPDQEIQPIGTNIATGTHRFWEALGIVGGLGFILHAVLTLIFVNQGFIFRIFSWLELTIGLITVTVDAWFLTHICLPICMQKHLEAAHPHSMSGVSDQGIKPIGTNVATGTHRFWEVLAFVSGFGLILHAVLTLTFVNQGFIFRILSWLELAAGLGTVAIDAWFLTHICFPSSMQKDFDPAQAYDSFIKEPILSPTEIDE